MILEMTHLLCLNLIYFYAQIKYSLVDTSNKQRQIMEGSSRVLYNEWFI